MPQLVYIIFHDVQFVARYFIPADKASDRAMKISFWSLNLGLLWMLFVNLFPLGLLQLNDSVAYGYRRLHRTDARPIGRAEPYSWFAPQPGSTARFRNGQRPRRRL